MKEPWKEGTFIQVRPVLGITGSVWIVDIVGASFYVLVKDDGRQRRKILSFANQDNWEEVPLNVK